MLLFSIVLFVISVILYFSTWSFAKDGEFGFCILIYIVSIFGGIISFFNLSFLKFTIDVKSFYSAVMATFILYLIGCRYTINLYNKLFANADNLKRLIVIRFFTVINSFVFIFWAISFYGLFIYKNGILSPSQLYLDYIQTHLTSDNELFLLYKDLFITGLNQLFTVNTEDTWLVFCNSYSVVCCSFFIVTVLNIVINIFNISKT